MLFDREFFDIAAPLFPDVTFHVIGGGRAAEELKHANVKIYGEMPYEQTLGYIKHADFGIAPYTLEHGQDYLCDTSMKLMQYALFGIAAICPRVVVGELSRPFWLCAGRQRIHRERGACGAESRQSQNPADVVLGASDRPYLEPAGFCRHRHRARAYCARLTPGREKRPPHEADHRMTQTRR